MGSQRVGHNSATFTFTLQVSSVQSLSHVRLFVTLWINNNYCKGLKEEGCYQLEYLSAAAAAKLLQSCLTLCDPMDYTVYGILQARILEWVAFPFSRVSSQPRDQTQVSHITGRFFTS